MCDGSLFSREGYQYEKREALRRLRHAVEQGEKDQWFSALRAIGEAAGHATSALQSIINRQDWPVPEETDR